MGISSLTTFINDAKSGFLEQYELHGGYVVIDGRSLMYHIYRTTPGDDKFGGDFDTFAQTVSKFFDDLLKCEIIPLIIFDGGKEPKKGKTAYKRWRQNIKLCKKYQKENPTSMNTKKRCGPPPSSIIVYMDILCQKSIKMCRSVFEADAEIAGVAKVLNCPVLSNDSDFYVFGVSYIPICTLKPSILSKNKGYFKPCKIYRSKNLLREFPCLDTTVLPLLAVLLGNDFTESDVLKAIFASLNILYEKRGSKIFEILQWLENYNLNNAVADILNKLPEKLRRRALCMIELVVNGYINTPCKLLLPLGFKDLYNEHTSRRPCLDLFKFQGDVEIFSSDDDTEKENSEDEYNHFDPKIEETWPPWFARRYYKAEFPPSFVNMMGLRLCIAALHIEDFRYPSPSCMSLNIIRVIDGLLVSGRSDQIPGLLYLTRDGENSNRRRLDEILSGTRSIKFPTLAELGDTKIDIKKRIIDDTLRITGKESFFEDLPAKWRLYIATIFFWMKSEEKPPRNSCHLYAMLLTMLIGLVDQKLGHRQPEDSFNVLFGKSFLWRKMSSAEEQRNALIQKNSIIGAVNSVTRDDCCRAALFSTSRREKSIKFRSVFDVKIVHVFVQFQECLRAAIALNCLLGYPYEHPIISEFYNGTMLYYLYTNFNEQSDVEAYIAAKLENSSSLLNLVKLLIAKMKHILEDEPK